MSIVLLIRSLNFGGAERQVIELAKGLASRGHDVVVAVFYGDGKLFGELQDAGVRLVVLQKRGRWDLISFLTRLIRVLRDLRPQILYAFMIEPSLLGVLMKPLLPSTRVVWGVRVSNLDFSLYDWAQRLTFRMSRALARFADLIIANSWSGAAHHQGLGYPADKMVVIPNGIDLSRFRRDPAAGRRQRLAWGIPDKVPVVGLVGRLDPMKDHGTFLKAARLLSDAEPRPWFVCVGDGPQHYRDYLRGLATDLGMGERVLWVGGQEDMVAAYNVLNVFCLCSAYGEGFSNALGEAMACGIPCVATDVGDAARILEGCTEVLAPGDPQRLADGIQRALSSGDSQANDVYRQRVERHFSVERMVAETERVLRECVNAA